MKYAGLFLHAPMQSWGGPSLPDPNSKSPRNTELHPTKSGILGMVRAALGKERGAPDEEDLRQARILVRIDRRGFLGKEYQVAERTHHGFTAGKTKEIPKFFIQEATFVALVGHENANTVSKVTDALRNPEWAPFLGRRSYTPAFPVLLGDVELENPRRFLEDELPVFWGADRVLTKRVSLQDSLVSDEERGVAIREAADEPLSFHPRDRSYGSRFFQVTTKIHNRENIASTGTPTEQYLRIVSAFGGVK